MNILDRMTEAEGAELQALRVAWEEATGTRMQHEKVKQEIQDQIYASESQVGRSVRASFKAYAAGKPAPQAEPGPSRQELLDAKKGAEATLREDREVEERAQGALRARTLAIAKVCADRLGPELVAAVRQVETLSNALAGAQLSLGSATGGAAELVDTAEWRKLYVPSSKSIPSLARAGREMGDNFKTPVLVYAADGYDKTAALAATELERAITKAVGIWPFGRSASVTSSATYPAAETKRAEQDEASRKSRRAAIERHAKGITP